LTSDLGPHDLLKATLKDGVLEVRLPKTERAKGQTPRKVAVE
jgi:HSP20 family molecular chaperone IbpA